MQQLQAARHSRGALQGKSLGAGLILSAIVGFVAASAEASAQAPGPTASDGALECRFQGWSNDPDEKGQPVRSGPSAGAPVIGRLPPPVTIGLDRLSVTVTVTGYREGWFRVAEAGYSDEVQGVRVPRNPVLAATGWVPASGVKSLLAARQLKAQPSQDSATLAMLAGFRRDSVGGQVGFGPDGVAVRRLVSCRSEWVEVETEFGIGWVDKVCARQLSACP
jgi:hypothetical protein